MNGNTTDEEIENYLTKVREWCKENGSEIAETEIDKIRTNAVNQRDALKPKQQVQPQVPAIPPVKEEPVVQPVISTKQQSDRLVTWGQPIENAVRSSLSIEDYNEDELKALMAKQDKTLAEQQKMSLMLSLRRAYYERDPRIRNVLLATARRQDMMYQSANRKNGVKPISTTPTIPIVGKGKFGRGFSKQNDPAIANMRFNVSGDTEYQTFGDSACGPTAAVNVMESLYGRGKEDVVNASQYALSKGYKERNGGTNPAFFRDYFSKNGIESDTTTDRAHMKHQIESGKPTILMGKDAQGTSSKTPYGKAPHYVTVTGMDRYGRAIVQDPEVKRDNLLYDVDDLVNKSSIGISAGMGKSAVSKYGRGMDERALQIRNYLMSKGVQENATYGILGNMQHESAMNPERMENLLAQEMRDSGKFPFINWPRNIYNETERYGHEYTEAINSGRISREEFLRPSVGKAAGKDKRGYGLVQFTSAGLKNQLYDATVSKGKSIGSLTDQLDSILDVINSNGGYKPVKEAMYNPNITPDAMADVFVRKYERPANVDKTAVDRIKSARQWQAKLSTNKNGAMPPEGESIPPQNGQTEGAVEGAVTAGSANDTANNPISASPGGALETILSKISEAFEAGFNKLLGIEPAPQPQSSNGSTVPGQVSDNTVPPTTPNPGETPPGVAPIDVQGTGIVTRPEDLTESPSKINSPFGYRIHPIKKVRKLHTGVDLLLYKLDRPKRFGHPVKIAADGVVSRVQNIKTGYGNNVIVDHGGGYQTLYAHLNDTAGISKGMKVKAGAPILHEGSSGGSTGPHLHFEVRKNQTPINPQTGLYEIAKMFQTSGPRDNNAPLTPTTNANMTSDQANLEQAMTPPADQTNPTQSSTGKGTSEPKITPEYGALSESKYGRGGFGQQLFSQVGIPFMQKLFGEMNKPKPAPQIPQAQPTTPTQTPRAAIPQNTGQTPPIVQPTQPQIPQVTTGQPVTPPATSDGQPTGDKEKEKNPLQNFSSLFNMTNIGSIASGLLTDRDRTISSVKDMVGNALTKDVQEGIKTSDKIDKPSGDFLSSVIGDLAPKAIKGQDISTRDVLGSTNKGLQGLLRDSGAPAGASRMLSSVMGAMTGDGGNPMVGMIGGFLDGLIEDKSSKPQPTPTEIVQNNAELGKFATQQPQATQPMQPGQMSAVPTTTPEAQQLVTPTQTQQAPMTITQPSTTEQPAQQPMQPQLPQAQPVTKPQEPQQIVIKPAPVDTRTVSPDYSKTLESIAQAAMRTAQNTDQLQLLVKLLQEKGVINVSNNDIANVQQGNSNAEKLATQFGKGKMKGNDKLATAAKKAQSRQGTGTVDASQLDTYANTVNNQGNNAIITMMQTLASE